MGNGLGGLTGSIVEYALDGLSLRHAAIASNIANSHSAGYQPIQVSFENYLADAISQFRTDTRDLDVIKGLPAPTVSPQFEAEGPSSSSSLEIQTVLLNQNVLQDQALITGLNKYMSSISIAINEGKK